jgi:hypothetical protein
MWILPKVVFNKQLESDEKYNRKLGELKRNMWRDTV